MIPEWAKPLNNGPSIPDWAKPIEQPKQKDFDYRTFATEEAKRQGVNPDDILSMIRVESGGNGNAISPKGATGYMQLMPGTAKDLGVDPNDPQQNIIGGIRYYKQMLDRFKGNRELALAAYNAGPGAVGRAGGVPNYKETKDYVAKITGKSAPELMRENLKNAPWLERQLVGAGGAMMGGLEGLKGLVGMSDPEEVDFTRVAQEEAPVGAILGNVAMMAPTAFIPGVNTVRGAATTGAIYNALTTPGDLNERRSAAIMGLLGGGAGQATSNALARAFVPNRGAQNLLSNEGITLTPGQNAGGMWKNFEDKAMSITFLGDAIASARKRSVEDFNRAAINRATIPGLDVDGIGNAAIQELRQGLGASFDDIAARSSIPGLDQEFMTNMVNLGQMAKNLPPQEAKEFTRVIQRELIERLGPNGQLNGKNINDAIAGIRDRAAQFKKSPGAWERDLGNALDEAAGEVFSLMERTNPQLARELLQTKKGWATFKSLQKAASSVGAEDGVFTPAQLHNAVKAGDRTKDKRAFSEGVALLQDLTSAGKAVLPSKLPNSGTADRLLSNVMNPLQWPGIAGGALASLPALAMYSRPGSQAVNAMYNRLANSGNSNALRLLLNPVLTQQLE